VVVDEDDKQEEWDEENNEDEYEGIIALSSRVFIDSVLPNPAFLGEVVQFSGHGDDLNITGYRWRSDKDGNLSTNATFSASSLSFGTHTIYFKVQYGETRWSDEASLILLIHLRPSATIEAISPNPALETDDIHFIGNGTDDGTIEGYSWRSSIDGEFYNGTSSDFYYSNLSNGTHYWIWLKVKDNYGVWSDEISIRLDINGVPLSKIDSITPNPARKGENVTFVGNGVDDGHIVRYFWRSSMNGDLYNGSSSSFTTAELSEGNHTVYLKVKDNNGTWSDKVVKNLYVNYVPTFVFEHPSQEGENADLSFGISWTDNDPDNNAKIALYYSTDKNYSNAVQITSGIQEDDNQDSYEWDITFLKEGEYFICAVLDDSFNDKVYIWSEGTVKVKHGIIHDDNITGDEPGFLPGFGMASVSVGVVVAAVWWKRQKEVRLIRETN